MEHEETPGPSNMKLTGAKQRVVEALALIAEVTSDQLSEGTLDPDLPTAETELREGLRYLGKVGRP